MQREERQKKKKSSKQNKKMSTKRSLSTLSKTLRLEITRILSLRKVSLKAIHLIGDLVPEELIVQERKEVEKEMLVM